MDQSNSIISTYRRNVESVQTNVSSTLNTENNITRILCTKATSYIDSYEAVLGELKFNGTVCFFATFVSEDGEISSINSSESFSGKLENSLITPTTNALINSNVIELKVDSSSNEIRLNATVENSFSLILSDNFNYYVNNDEDIVTNSNVVNFSSLVSNGKLSFNFDESFETKDSVEKILNVSSTPKILDYSLGTDYFTVEGILFVNVLYEITSNEKKELRQYTNCYKFKEELEVEGITKDGYLLINSFVNNCAITSNLENKDNSYNINFTIPVTVHYAYLKPTTSEIVVDAYSLKNKLNLSIESFKIDGLNFTKTFDEKIDGQTVIAEDAPRIMKFVSYCGENISITNSFVNNNNIVVEGIASVNVIYLEEDDNEQLNSLIIEVPFSIENKCDDIKESDELLTSAIIKDIDVKCKKGKEINVELDVCFMVNTFNSLEEMALTNVTIGEELTPKEACLQIYFARRGNTLWDISKNLTARPEQILNQNPNINLPLEQDEKIVLFNGVDKENN